MVTNYLITGSPGSGKTTLLRRLSQKLVDIPLGGFLTREIRQQGVRQGFTLESFQGKKAVLAHVSFPRTIAVGKYGVDLAALEDFVEEMMTSQPVSLWIIDEIGKMECYSSKFTQVVGQLLDSPVPVVASVALKGGGFIAEVKQRPDVQLFHLTAQNRELLVTELEKLIRKALPLKKEK